ncbi:glycine cleavage system H protein [Nocardia transvalensis]|uniref:Glycine cleavage system H protein n=1 Tax=Nocardia transvalensis TaxID=37333 RepID=A0A7W9UGZ9_9NOCA|nr:glycine cleavage system protein H [Nocardia transvalensis]MBB5912195.1 glycine cleavage system H protein [Nocardia transvalensis]
MQVQHFPIDRSYTEKHGWLALAPGDRFSDYPLRVGLTPAFVADRDIVALDLPLVRTLVEAGAPCGAVRTAGHGPCPIYAPISGLVTIHNAAAIARPELVAEDPFHAGWLFAVLPTPGSTMNGLLTAAP